MGRPSSYTPEIAESICDRLAEGEYLTDILKDEGFPSYKTVRKWIVDFPEFSKSIARASEDQADYFRWKISKLNDGMNAENWQFRNAQIRNIQWMMGRIKPRAYGDKLAVGGADDLPAIQAAVTVEFVKSGNSGTDVSK